jgi:hypothetical protein
MIMEESGRTRRAWRQTRDSQSKNGRRAQVVIDVLRERTSGCLVVALPVPPVLTFKRALICLYRSLSLQGIFAGELFGAGSPTILQIEARSRLATITTRVSTTLTNNRLWLPFVFWHASAKRVAKSAVNPVNCLYVAVG